MQPHSLAASVIVVLMEFVCAGEPMLIEKAVCMHEEDAGLLWKHVEYRTNHSEVRRSRRLVLSFVATVRSAPSTSAKQQPLPSQSSGLLITSALCKPSAIFCLE